MARAFRTGNYSVYVWNERAERHHRAHGHVYLGRSRIASVYLETLTVYDDRQRLPRHLLARIEEEQDALLRLWMELNPDG